MPTTAHYATWDDHEVDNNWDPEQISSGRLQAAIESFFESLPVRRDVASPDRIWRSFRWGATLELFMLDARGETLPSTKGATDAQYVSLEQIAWLKDGLFTSEATFKIIVTSLPITNFPLAFSVLGDRWEDFDGQRDDLIDFIVDEEIGGVLFISGDFHLGSAGAIEKSGPGAALNEVLVGPGAQIPSPLVSTLGAPQFQFATGAYNYVLFDADPIATPATLGVTFVGASGETLYSTSYRY